jgi:hypothetical protein
MEKEFIPYMIAFDMMAIGFKESCIATIDQTEYLHIKGTKSLPRGSMMYDTIDCPTFSQAFRWFREKYNLHAEPYTADMGAIEYCFQIRDLYSEKYIYDNFRGAGNSYMGTFNTPEEAELECLKKLIEIVKEK